ncbi:MAG: arginine deiminase-related protein [Planctomycetes bacterium]|nr:arginine deiminase-related protein [Planctomycetota bacterium]
MTLYRNVDELDFRFADLPRIEHPDRVLMADPRDFECAYAINPHMVDERGELKRVDRELAVRQWRALHDAFAASGLTVDVVAPLAKHPDLVFCANPSLPLPRELFADGRPRLVPSRMAHAERRGEVDHVVAALRALGYVVEPLRGESERLEGMGDGIWQLGRALLFAGVGPRSDLAAWRELAERYPVRIVALELVDRALYHLDTAFASLSDDACLWWPGAFDARGRALIERLVPRPIEADADESRRFLACNAFSANGRHVFIERRCERTIAKLVAAGFDVVPLDTSEFLKSGGSVFCMKLAHGPL